MTALLARGGSDAVGVVLVGDELLLGSVVDTNGAWLAQTLTAAGLRLVQTVVVPDDTARIAAAVSSLATWVGTVIVSGGIGPTSDDLTREALADVAGCDLVPDDDAVRAVTAWYAARGRAPSHGALRMARRPSCGRMLVNPEGSAPGVRLELGDCVVYSVPGVPSELTSMVRTVVLPDVVGRTDAREPLHSVSVEVALLGESAVAELLGEVEHLVGREPATDLAYLARPAHVSVRVSVRDRDDERAAQRLASWRTTIERALGSHVIGHDGTTLPEAVVSALAQAGSTVAAAESLTGGGLLAALTGVPGASAVVRGGVVAYATDVKGSMLAVAPALLAERGPVDADVAMAMATGARTVLGADWGLATTGVAGPEPVGRHRPGHVHVAVSGPDGVSARTLSLPGGRERVRVLATAHVLDDLRLRLTGNRRSR